MKIKKFIALIFSVMAIVTTILPASAATLAVPFPSGATFTTKIVTAENGKPVNLRKGPGTSYGIITTIAVNKSVQAALYPNNSSWSMVKYNGTEGYMMSSFLRNGTSDNTPTTPSSSIVPFTSNAVFSEKRVYASNGKPVRLRRGPGTSYDIIMSIAVGRIVEAAPYGSTGWSMVKYNGTEGYMMSSFLVGTGSSTPAPQPSNITIGTYIKMKVISDNGGRVRIRREPSLSSDVINHCEYGTIVDAAHTNISGWYAVKYNGTSGYMQSNYLTTNNVITTKVPSTCTVCNSRMIQSGLSSRSDTSDARSAYHQGCSGGTDTLMCSIHTCRELTRYVCSANSSHPVITVETTPAPTVWADELNDWLAHRR